MNKVEKIKAEIKKRYKDNQADGYTDVCEELFDLCTFIDSLEEDPVNNDLEEAAVEALRTEYEKGRADVIADTISWLANCWPQYCSNPTIIDGFKEAIQYD